MKMPNGQEIEIRYLSNPAPLPTLNVKDVPIGFFRGKIGDTDGLFLRSYGHVSCVNAPSMTWTWSAGSNATATVNFYRAVSVEINVSE